MFSVGLDHLIDYYYYCWCVVSVVVLLTHTRRFLSTLISYRRRRHRCECSVYKYERAGVYVGGVGVWGISMWRYMENIRRKNRFWRCYCFTTQVLWCEKC